MKLQRNNKYVKRLTTGLTSAILSASILVGCSNTQALTPAPAPTPTEIVEVEETPIIKDKFYYMNYYKMSDEEVEKELKNYELKFPNAKWRMNQIYSLVIKDKDDNYKVLQLIDRTDYEKNITRYYDAFTEEFLFSTPVIDIRSEKNKIVNFDPKLVENSIEYFDDKEILEMGICVYSCLFVNKHIDYLRERDNIEYFDPGYEPATIMYPNKFETAKLHYSIEEILKTYIKTVPEECRVTSKELGVKPTYREEEKYMDFWKISEEEKKERLEQQEIFNGDNIINMSYLFTLILKDASDNYKIMPVLAFDEDNCTCFYNAITGTFLFSTPLIDFTIGLSNEYYEDLYNNKIEYIPYLEDKKMVKFGSCFEMNSFVGDNLEELKEKDGIDYMKPDEEIRCYLYKDSNSDFVFSSDEYEFSINEIADAYVTVIPENMQVITKELNIGLDEEIENTNVKALVK